MTTGYETGNVHGGVSFARSISRQCMACGSVYTESTLVSPPTLAHHPCLTVHQGPWNQVSLNPYPNGVPSHNVPNGYMPNGYAPNGYAPKGYMPNGYPQNGYGHTAHHHVQKSSSFKPGSPSNKNNPSTGSPRVQNESKSREPLSMEMDLNSVDPHLLEKFKMEVASYNTEVELTFGSNLNFTEKLAVFVNNIKAHKMTNLITQVLSWKQDIILSETVTTDNGQHSQQKIKNENHVIDEKPSYVRSVLQLLYHAFLSTIYRDPQYHDFYEQYYETESEQSVNPKKKSGPQQEVDPFFQCFYECSTLYAHSALPQGHSPEELRKYLEVITSNIFDVLRLINAVLEWSESIKTNSMRLVLTDSDIDISLYEFSQMLLTTPLETQHAVWQRIQKNEENQIADSQNLSLCIHILLCIAIKSRSTSSKYPNTENPDQIYAAFLEKIVSCLSAHFLRKSSDSAGSGIIMEFGDLVEKLPLWLLYCDQMLQRSQPKGTTLLLQSQAEHEAVTQ